MNTFYQNPLAPVNNIPMYQTLPRGQVVIMSYPKIELMLTGVAKVTQNRKGIITLTYSDGTAEQRKNEKGIETLTLFEIVSFVQAGRKGEKTIND